MFVVRLKKQRLPPVHLPTHRCSHWRQASYCGHARYALAELSKEQHDTFWNHMRGQQPTASVHLDLYHFSSALHRTYLHSLMYTCRKAQTTFVNSTRVVGTNVYMMHSSRAPTSSSAKERNVMSIFGSTSEQNARNKTCYKVLRHHLFVVDNVRVGRFNEPVPSVVALVHQRDLLGGCVAE